MEETKKIGNIILTIVVLLALGFGIYYLVSRSDVDNTANDPAAGSDYYVSVVQVKHQYADGTHTYVGSIDLPSACYSLESNSAMTGETAATINLTTTMSAEEVCAQVVTTRDFRVQIDGPENLTVSGMLNGRPVELNLFEVPADEDIDEFEINIKG